MSRRQELERHRHNVGEIRNIMNSMKTLAYMETRKLARFLEAQQAVVQSIETLASDFLSTYPGLLEASERLSPVYLLLGSERGFCGDFNQAIARQADAEIDSTGGPEAPVIAVGGKLHPLCEPGPRKAEFITGASVAEEIPTVLSNIAASLASLQPANGMALYGIFHGNGEVICQRLLPAFSNHYPEGPGYPHPPMLHLSPAQFLAELVDHHLFAALHTLLYTSLMAENHRRANHLERAVKHLDKQSDALGRTCSALRQEEIIEEIEVIMLSAPSLDEFQPDSGS